MQVLVYVGGVGDALTESGFELQRRAHIGDVATHGRGHMGAVPFEAFSRRHPHGITVPGPDQVLLIIGGRKSIVAAMTNHPFQLIPTPGESLSMRVIRANGAAVPTWARFCFTMDAPKLAHGHGQLASKNVFKQMAAGAKQFAAIHKAIDETSKMFTYIQLYSGQAKTGDHGVGTGVGAVSTTALAVQLPTLSGWSK
jgi:hypothetical protein